MHLFDDKSFMWHGAEWGNLHIKKRKILKIYFMLAAGIMILTGIYLAAEILLGPVLEDVAEVRVKELAAASINDSVTQLMEEMPERSVFGCGVCFDRMDSISRRRF